MPRILHLSYMCDGCVSTAPIMRFGDSWIYLALPLMAPPQTVPARIAATSLPGRCVTLTGP